MIDIFINNLDAVICMEIICGIVICIKLRYTIYLNNSLFKDEKSKDLYNKYCLSKDDIENTDARYSLLLLNIVLITTLVMTFDNIVLGLFLSILLIILEIILYRYILYRIKLSGKVLYILKKELLSYRSGEGHVEDCEYILNKDTGVLQKELSITLITDIIMIVSYLYLSVKMILIFI